VRTSDFDYHLPDELIAQEPLAERSASRLLVVRRAVGAVGAGEAELTTERLPPLPPLPPLSDRHFADLPSLIPAGDLLVLNTTRVRPARLLGTRPSGAPAEVLLLHPGRDGCWVAMGKPGSALRPGKRIVLTEGLAVETVEVLDEGYRLVRFVGGTAEEAMARVGRMPLPPYITRAEARGDRERYQTVYAEREGSVAAPTAGLHFTPRLLGEVERRQVRIARLDLEVGPGTFRPVEVADPARHPMHPEHFEIPAATAAAVSDTRKAGAKVWAVGTTVVRALESAAGPGGTVRAGPADTSLLILPGYQFRVVDHLITNFHLPRSTLLMLVSALVGRETLLRAYAEAVREKYRFYSFGDAMLCLL
jgi:S-adenosylmethionine:tRNA ribosyltransferase-isomerase